jgi:hypothetical protein
MDLTDYGSGTHHLVLGAVQFAAPFSTSSAV